MACDSAITGHAIDSLFIAGQGAGMAMKSLFSDPMLRMLAAAITLAIVFPVVGDGRVVAQMIANGAIFLLFLLNGMRIARGDIAAGLRHARFLLPLMAWVFGAMALAGLGLSQIGQTFLPPMLALGFLYLGCLPSTVQSATSYSSLAGGNVALSVIAAALLNIMGVFVSVPIFLALGGSGDGAIGTDAILKILAILILPFAIGQLVQNKTQAFVLKNKKSIVWMDRTVIAIAVYVAFSGAVEQGIWSKVDPLGWVGVAALAQLYLFFAHAGAWYTGGTLHLARPDRIAFLFAGAQKSAAIGVPLATVLFSGEKAGFIVLPLLLYHLSQLVVAAPLANYLRHHAHDSGGSSGSTTRS